MKTKFSGILTLFLAFVVQLTFAQEKSISGTISDENGLPMPGVNIVVVGTSNGTQTDFDGKYSLSASVGDVLRYSSVGYTTTDKTVGSSNNISFALEVNVEAIDEVVITALGIKRKESEITSSNQNVKAEEITQAANPNIVQSLTGKVSGLTINTTNNGVNPTSKVTLRGNSSITGSNSALVIIDGVISSLGVLNNLPPDIVDSVNVLKGAQGAALYGSQAGNGVIIVTTKGGSEKERIEVQINSSTDFQSVNFVPQRQNKYGQGWNGDHVTYENGGWGPEFDGTLQPVGLAQADGSYILAPYSAIEDNIKDFFNTGTTYQNSISISGSGQGGSVLLSLNRQDTEFVVEDDKLKRTTAFLKATKQFGKFNADAAVTYYTRGTSTTTSGLLTELLQTATNIPVEQFSAPFNQYHWTSYYRSPYWMRENIRRNNDTQYFSGNVGLRYEINENINVSYRANLQTVTSDGLNYTNAYTDLINVGGGDHTTASRLDITDNGSRTFYGDLRIDFDYDLTEDISFSANVGYNSQDFRSTSTSVGGDNLTIPGFYNISNITGTPSVSNSEFTRRSQSVFAQLDFGYKDYLFLNLTGRNDWRSTLDPTVNSVFYPSVGLSFLPTKAIEGLKGDILNDAKIYTNYSRVGRTNVGTYAINDLYGQPGGFPFGGINTFVPNAATTDALLQNELVDSFEIGFNLGFLNDRITLDFSYFNTVTTDADLNTTPSLTSGTNRARINVGEFETNGFEIDLGFTPIKNREIGLEWNNRISFATDETIVNKVTENSTSVALQSFAGVGIFAEEGKAFPLIKGTGYQRDPQGRVIIDPTTVNPLKTAEFIDLGVNNPKYTVGLSSNLSYKGFKLSAVMDYRTGHKFWAGTKDWLSWSGHLVESAENGRRGFIFPNSSVETSPGSGVYAANTGVLTGGTTYTDYLNYFSNEYRDVTENFVLDATAFKVREIALAYTFDGDALKSIGITGLTLGVNARNPFIVLPKENRNYHDPENSNTAGNASGLAVTGQYPATKTYGFNVNLTF